MIFSSNRKQQIWIRLSTRSRRALMKIYKKFGHLYEYKPRGDLLANISQEFNITIQETNSELLEMRQEFLKSFKI